MRDPRHTAGVSSGDVATVAGEHFVAAIPIQDHRDMLSGHLGDLETGDSAGVSEWLVVVPYHGLKPFYRVETQG